MGNGQTADSVDGKVNIEILEEAENDLINGYRFYENQERGLGEYFLDSLCADIDSLQIYAGIHSKHYGFHRLLAKRFPFAVYYKTDKETAYVYAVLDCRKNPLWIQKKLRPQPAL